MYHQVLNAKHYGVPQHRERIFIVGVRFSDKPFTFPQGDPQNIVPLKSVLSNVPDSQRFSYSERKREFFQRIPQGGCWTHLPQDLQLLYMGEKMLKSGGGKRGVLRRLSMEEPSLTLLCTPSQKQTERCHPLEDRPLRLREISKHFQMIISSMDLLQVNTDKSETRYLFCWHILWESLSWTIYRK
ncbi:hypothetical protein EBS02_10470 [bacterium]|nr:hypothetical protein [bacterium]